MPTVGQGGNSFGFTGGGGSDPYGDMSNASNGFPGLVAGVESEGQLRGQLSPLEQQAATNATAGALPNTDALALQLSQATDQTGLMGMYGHGGSYGDQQQAANLMYQQALGNGPSIASAQMQQGLAQGNAMSAHLLAGTGNQQGGAGLRDALQANAEATQQAAGSGAIARAQEQLGALSQYGNQTNALSATQLQAQQNQLQGYQQALATAAKQQEGNLAQAGLDTDLAKARAQILQDYVHSQTGAGTVGLTNIGNSLSGLGAAASGIVQAAGPAAAVAA